MPAQQPPVPEPIAPTRDPLPPADRWPFPEPVPADAPSSSPGGGETRGQEVDRGRNGST